LVAAEPGEAIGKGDDDGWHALFPNQPVEPFRQVLSALFDHGRNRRSSCLFGRDLIQRQSHRRHPVDSAPWANSPERSTPWRRKRDSNSRSPREGDAFRTGLLDIPGCKLPRDRATPPQGDQRFESPSLQRGVKCEPDFLDQEAVSQGSLKPAAVAPSSRWRAVDRCSHSHNGTSQRIQHRVRGVAGDPERRGT
jgi:hypothetical protein